MRIVSDEDYQRLESLKNPPPPPPPSKKEVYYGRMKEVSNKYIGKPRSAMQKQKDINLALFCAFVIFLLILTGILK